MSSQPSTAAAAEASLVVEEHRSSLAFSTLATEWRKLETSSGVPFTSVDWARTWWEHLRGEKFGVRDSLSLRTMRTADGTLVAIAPMVISRRPSVGPICLRQLQFIGADPNITELRGLIAAPEWQAAGYKALVHHALRNTTRWDTMQLAGVPPGLDLGPVAASPDFAWSYETSEFQLCLPDSWPAFRAGLPRNIKESLRKCYNSLKRADLAFRFDVISRPEDVGTALESFFELHAARAARTDTIDHANVFGTPTSPATTPNLRSTGS